MIAALSRMNNSLTKSGLRLAAPRVSPEERAQSLDSPGGPRTGCAPAGTRDNARQGSIIFGPNRRRDSSQWGAGGDDIGVIFRVRKNEVLRRKRTLGRGFRPGRVHGSSTVEGSSTPSTAWSTSAKLRRTPLEPGLMHGPTDGGVRRSCHSRSCVRRRLLRSRSTAGLDAVPPGRDEGEVRRRTVRRDLRNR